MISSPSRVLELDHVGSDDVEVQGQAIRRRHDGLVTELGSEDMDGDVQPVPRTPSAALRPEKRRRQVPAQWALPPNGQQRQQGKLMPLDSSPGQELPMHLDRCSAKQLEAMHTW